MIEFKEMLNQYKWRKHKILPWWILDTDPYYGLVQNIEPVQNQKGVWWGMTLPHLRCWFSEVGRQGHLVKSNLPIKWLYHSNAREAFRYAELEIQKLRATEERLKK